MFVDIEETLGRELREVADGLHIPVMPPLPQDPPRTQRHRQPLLVAAAIVLIVAGAVAVVATPRGGQELGPAPPSPSRTESEPSPSRTEPVVTIPTTAPTVPYVLEQRLYVDGEQVPGTWWSVQVGDAGWLAQRTDNTWWWGRGPEPNEITGWHDVPPVISPNGRYVAHAGIDNGEGVLTGFDTRPGGEGLGSVPIDLGDPQDGSTVFIRAVTNDGKVIAQGTNTRLLWLPLAGNGTVDLTVTAPRQLILGSTAAGLIANDEAGGTEPVDGEPYLAQISDNGELTRISAIPAHDDLMVSPGAGWLAWTPAGTTGGEVTSIPALEAQTVDGTQQVTLTAPAGWGFRVRAWMWEDDNHLISPVIRDGDGGERMARCSAQSARCVLINTP
ncbi:MAG: hypothetical protein WKF72_01115 [Nocardioidaceae bacterium]